MLCGSIADAGADECPGFGCAVCQAAAPEQGAEQHGGENIACTGIKSPQTRMADISGIPIGAAGNGDLFGAEFQTGQHNLRMIAFMQRRAPVGSFFGVAYSSIRTFPEQDGGFGDIGRNQIGTCAQFAHTRGHFRRVGGIDFPIVTHDRIDKEQTACRLALGGFGNAVDLQRRAKKA